MVIQSVSDVVVVGVVRIVVVSVVGPIFWIQSFHSERSQKMLFGLLQGNPSMFWVEQFRCYHHGNREVTSQLEVGPFLARPVTILVNSSLVDQIRPNFIRYGCRIHPEILFEVLLDFVGPLFECPLCHGSIFVYSFHPFVRIDSALTQLVQPRDYRFRQSYQFDSGAISWGRRFATIGSLIRRPHLVHPRAAIEGVSAENKSGFGVNSDLIIKTLVCHVFVDLSSGVAFAED